MQRAQGEAEITVRRFEQPLSEAAEAKLEVFYPGGTLAGTVRTRQVLSLAVIQATSDNLRAGAVSDPARLPRYAEVIHGQVKRLAGMVESILLYAGLESGMARRPAPAEVDLPRLVEEVTQPLQQLAADRGCCLTVSASPLPATVCTDGTALRLVIENLVANAIHHAGASEVRLGVKPYYLYYADLVEGTGHFRTEVNKGREICRDLCGATTGFLRPTYVIDAMGGRGKVPVDLGYSEGISEDRRGGVFTSAIGLGKVYVNDPIERIEGKPSRHNPNRK